MTVKASAQQSCLFVEYFTNMPVLTILYEQLRLLTTVYSPRSQALSCS
jgi:hypothetical protein